MRQLSRLRMRLATTLLVPALRFAALAAITLLGASVARAQSVDPGMSREQVVARLGRPVGERTSGPRTYLFYRNGCEQTCGMHDLVVLEGDAVVDAIFRKSGRRYSGESSSPAAVPPRNSERGARARRTSGRGAAGGSAQAGRAPAGDRVALPPGTRRGGIVVGGGGADTAAADVAPARRSVRGVAGAAGSAGSGQPADSAAAAARPRSQAGGDVRVPIVPRDTQLGVQPRERGKRTLPGPVIVPTTPRDTQVARPDTGRRQQPAPPPPRPPAGQSDSTNPTSTSSPR